MNDFPLKTLDKNKTKYFSTNLLRWFIKNQRELPFRKTKDPYAIWVAETMLQQTQIKTMLPYYERFMKRFATLKDLAQANIEEVLTFWSGLGYYRRARFLHEGAKRVIEQHNGIFPEDIESVLALPGVGPYTAGAILSIAFNQSKPVLDGNVIRVLCRFFEIEGNTRKKKTNQQLWDLAEILIPTGKASNFNQAMMELGALICKPQKPHCIQCPVIDHCVTYKHGTIDQFPKSYPRPRTEKINILTAVIRKNGEILLAKRKLKGHLGGMWEFPNNEKRSRLQSHNELRKCVKKNFNLDIKVKESLVNFHHSIMNRSFSVETYWCDLKTNFKVLIAKDCVYEEIQWFRPDKIASIPMSSAPRTIMDAIIGEGTLGRALKSRR